MYDVGASSSRLATALGVMAMTERARICVIDDDIFVCQSLALGLREAGYEVSVAPGAVAGLDFVGRNGAEAIITDMMMPGTDGAELIAQARAAWPPMIIIAISGAGVIAGRDVTALAEERGADAVLNKPFGNEDLRALVARLLADRGQRPAT